LEHHYLNKYLVTQRREVISDVFAISGKVVKFKNCLLCTCKIAWQCTDKPFYFF